MPDITLARDEEIVQGAIDFKMFSGLLKTMTLDDGTMVIHGVASSTVEDHNGDKIEESAIADMVAAANNNMTIFLNHSYNVPEDVGGSVRLARAAIAGQGAEGPIWDMSYDVAVDDTNPRAVQTFNSIDKKGTKLGLSIGARIPDGGATVNKKTGRYRFHHLELLETSIVGLPANPRSWIQSITKSLRPDEEEPFMLDTIAKSDAEDVVTTEDLPVAEPPTDPSTDPDPSDEDGEEAPQGAPESEPGEEPAEPGEVVQSISAATLSEALTIINDLSQELVQERLKAAAAEKARDEAFELADKVVREAADIVQKMADIPLGRRAVYKEVQDDLGSLERIYGESLVKRMRGINTYGS